MPRPAFLSLLFPLFLSPAVPAAGVLQAGEELGPSRKAVEIARVKEALFDHFSAVGSGNCGMPGKQAMWVLYRLNGEQRGIDFYFEQPYRDVELDFHESVFVKPGQTTIQQGLMASNTLIVSFDQSGKVSAVEFRLSTRQGELRIACE